MLRFILNSGTDIFQRNSTALISIGIVAVLIGLIIVLVPEILIAFIASIFFMIGFSLIYLGWRIRKEAKNEYDINIDWQ